jgi:hypothetical protein
MKTTPFLTRVITLAYLAVFIISGCKKETSSSNLTSQQEEEIASFSAESETNNEVIFNDVFDNVLGVNNDVGMAGLGVFGRKSNTLTGGRESGMDSITCYTISITHLNAPDIFPIKIEIDFRGGCQGKDGHVRSGKMISTYTGRLTIPGKSVTTVFEGFRFDSLTVEGNQTVTNSTNAGSIRRQFTIDIKDGKLTTPSGSYSAWTSHRVITQIEGNGTPDLPLDDIFSITGNAHGKLKRGDILNAWQSEILDPLIKRFTCHWISKGTLKVWRETLQSTSPWAGTLNYGDGTCDYIGMLTINGISRTVKLPH